MTSHAEQRNIPGDGEREIMKAGQIDRKPIENARREKLKRERNPFKILARW